MTEVGGFQRIRRRRDVRSQASVFGCDKQGFESYRAAKKKLRSGWERTMGGVAPYHCGNCGLWHIGNPSGFKGVA